MAQAATKGFFRRRKLQTTNTHTVIAVHHYSIGEASEKNTFCVNGLVGLICLTVVMNFPVRNIFLPFFLINFRLSEMHQYFLSVTLGTVRVSDSAMIHDVIQDVIHDHESP